MPVKTIGVVLETKEDAQNTGITNLDHLYHWREPEEIEAITNAIQFLGFETVILGAPSTVARDSSRLKKVDFIFNLSVGFSTRFRLSLGPSLYELWGLPYSGADPYTKTVSQNKHLMKSFWDKQGISTPAWVYLHDQEDLPEVSFPGFPLIIKPAYEGSSIGLGQDAVVDNKSDLLERIHRIFTDFRMPVIVERFISGPEYKVGVIGNENPEFLGIIEDTIRNGSPLNDHFLHFHAKSTGLYQKVQRNLNAPEFTLMRKDVLKIYRRFLPVDYGTFDLRLDDRGQHYFLEFNADATLHPQRTLAQCCALNGLGFHEMIEKILQSSFRRWGITWN